MATYTLYAYVGTDTPSKLAIRQTRKSINSGAVVDTTTYLDWTLFTRIEITLRDSESPATTITADSVANPEVFNITGTDNYELELYLGHITGITANENYQMLIMAYDNVSNDDGRVLAHYSADGNTDTIIVKAY